MTKQEFIKACSEDKSSFNQFIAYYIETDDKRPFPLKGDGWQVWLEKHKTHSHFVNAVYNEWKAKLDIHYKAKHYSYYNSKEPRETFIRFIKLLKENLE